MAAIVVIVVRLSVRAGRETVFCPSIIRTENAADFVTPFWYRFLEGGGQVLRSGQGTRDAKSRQNRDRR
jgi:hypothetical protein